MSRLFRLGVPVLMWIAVGAAALPEARRQPAPRRALAIEDYYRIQTVGSPAMSPNGNFVVFTVSTRIEEDNTTRTETWLVPADGSLKPWRVLHYGRDVTGARWSDDNRLEYAADRQQWRIDPQDPDAAPVRVGGPGGGERGARGGRGGQGAQSAVVPSPDGKWLATTADKAQPSRLRLSASAGQAPPPPSEISDFERRHEERFKGAIFDWKDFQRDGQPFPVPDPRARAAAQIVVTPAGGGERKVLVDLDLRPTGLAWHPSGAQMVFIADPDWRNELKYESPDLWTVTVDGKVTRLTDDGFVYSDASFSPDGKYLSYVRDPGTDLIIQQKLNHGGPSDLYVRPVAGGPPSPATAGTASYGAASEAVNLTANCDLEPGPTKWSPDGRFIYFTAGVGGESHLFRVSVPAGRVEQVTKGPRRITALTFNKAFTRIAYLVGVHEAPPEVYVASIDGTDERRLTDVHKAITTEIAFSKADCLHWASHDGTRIEGWLMFPYGYDAKKGPYPLIVTSHGGPHSATGYSFDFKDQYFAANGYFVFDTNFRSSTGYGEAFKWATWGEWGKKDGEDVVSGIDYVLKQYPIDAKRVGHTGHSYGGFMTNWLITQYPDRFAAAITGAGITNWMSDYGTADIYRTKETEFYGTPWDPAARDRMIKQSPLAYAGNVKTPTLFIHGEVDQRVPYEEGEQMYFALKRRGVPAKMIQYAGQPHGISGHWNNVHRMINELKWWERYLKGASTTSTLSLLPVCLRLAPSLADARRNAAGPSGTVVSNQLDAILSANWHDGEMRSERVAGTRDTEVSLGLLPTGQHGSLTVVLTARLREGATGAFSGLMVRVAVGLHINPNVIRRRSLRFILDADTKRPKVIDLTDRLRFLDPDFTAVDSASATMSLAEFSDLRCANAVDAQIFGLDFAFTTRQVRALRDFAARILRVHGADRC